MFYVFLADGFEEAEALVPVDLLRRADVEVRTVGVTGKQTLGSKRIPVLADISPEEAVISECEGILLPGGMPGTENLYRSDFVREAVLCCAEKGVPVAAICAAPSIPGRMGLLQGRKAVCFPGFESYLTGASIPDKPVVSDGCFITARGAGCAFLFAHAIIERLRGKETADRILAEIQYAC